MKLFSLLLGLLLLAAAPAASACSVPVFRYALNYWPADTYELRGHAIKLPDVTVNLETKEQPAGDASLLFDGETIWSGALDAATLAALLDSPVRQKIVSRIIAGDSVVWVLVESGNRKQDDAAATTLTDRLKYLESIAVMPELRPDDPFNRVGPGPALTIRHSVVRLSRTDPKEAFTLKLLERGAPADTTASKGPVAYPIFGRGRVLIALPQEKLTADNIDEIALFLTSACSCEVKDRRQGWDLLMQVDWDEELAKAEQRRVNGDDAPAPAPTPAAKSAPATQAALERSDAPETVTISAHSAPGAAVSPSPRYDARWITRAAVVGFALILGASLIGMLLLRKRA
jgi:hypothetical protein